MHAEHRTEGRPDGRDGQHSREEDFRDYDQNDIADGWPYADEAGAPVKNPAYGEREDDLEPAAADAFRTVAVDADGFAPSDSAAQLPGPDREDSDQLEADITERLEALADIDLNNLDVHVEGDTVTLDGIVDTREERAAIAAAVLAVPGVERVVNLLRTAGVDTRIPDED